MLYALIQNLAALHAYLIIVVEVSLTPRSSPLWSLPGFKMRLLPLVSALSIISVEQFD